MCTQVMVDTVPPLDSGWVSLSASCRPLEAAPAQVGTGSDAASGLSIILLTGGVPDHYQKYASIHPNE